MIKLVIVANDLDIVGVMVDYLKIRGFKVLGSGRNYKDAVILYQSLRPDIILVDFDIYGLEWERMIDKIKEYDHDAKVLVFSSVDDKTKLMKKHPSAILKKPFEINTLVRTIKEVVHEPETNHNHD